MQFGASIWPFQWIPPYEDGIKRLARLGFKNLELIAWDRQTLDDYYTPERIRSLKGLIADQGMAISELRGDRERSDRRGPRARACPERSEGVRAARSPGRAN